MNLLGKNTETTFFNSTFFIKNLEFSRFFLNTHTSPEYILSHPLYCIFQKDKGTKYLPNNNTKADSFFRYESVFCVLSQYKHCRH